MIQRVQVFTPVAQPEVRPLEPETVAAVLALQWSGPISWVFQRDNPRRGGDHAGGTNQDLQTSRLNILHQYQQGRERFLASNDDALLVIESDIVPPPDALQKLAALDCDVAYGVYRFRRGVIINIFERYPGQPRNEGESLTLHPAKLRQARQAGIVPCSGAGVGCVLIKRHVLEAIDFRLKDGDGGHCDTYFNRDVLRAGYRQMADMSVLCGHKHDLTGEILWPFRE